MFLFYVLVFFGKKEIGKKLVVKCWWNWYYIMSKAPDHFQFLYRHYLWRYCCDPLEWRASISGVHNSNLMAGQIFFWHMQKLIGCNTFKECFYQRNKQNKHNLGLAGQIKSFWGPHLARGPYVVHVCSIPLLILLRNLNVQHNTCYL